MLRKAALAFWLVLCICLMIVPLAPQAQKPAAVYRIGWLSPDAADPFALNLLDRDRGARFLLQNIFQEVLDHIVG